MRSCRSWSRRQNRPRRWSRAIASDGRQRLRRCQHMLRCRSRCTGSWRRGDRYGWRGRQSRNWGRCQNRSRSRHWSGCWSHFRRRCWSHERCGCWCRCRNRSRRHGRCLRREGLLCQEAGKQSSCCITRCICLHGKRGNCLFAHHTASMTQENSLSRLLSKRTHASKPSPSRLIHGS